jgi:DNA-directed RNA polymerase subunit RPC12/RpoP
MSGLACWSCGRQIYTVSPLESLTAEERRCPRCGTFLHNERRADERRAAIRRQNAAADPGPPGGTDRREEDRRRERRRMPADGTGRTTADEALRRTG